MLRDVRSFHFPFHLRRRVPGQLLSDLVRRTLRVRDARSLRVSEEVRSGCGMNKWIDWHTDLAAHCNGHVVLLGGSFAYFPTRGYRRSLNWRPSGLSRRSLLDPHPHRSDSRAVSFKLYRG